MSVSTLQFRYAVGLKTSVQGSPAFVDDTHVLYVSGNNLILHDIQTNEQKYIPSSPTCESITCLSVSHGNRYVAFGELGCPSSISIFDLRTLKRRATVPYPESHGKAFLALDFSMDVQSLAVLLEGPDYQVAVWNWSKGVLLASLTDPTLAGEPSQYSAAYGATSPASPKASEGSGKGEEKESQSGPVSLSPDKSAVFVPPYGKGDRSGNVICAFNPSDSSMLCVGSSHIIRFFRTVDDGLRTLPSVTPESSEFTASTWMRTRSDCIIASNATGSLVVLKAGEKVLEYPLPSSIEKRWICSIVETSRGLLVCGMQGGSVVVLECKETEDSISFSFLKQVSPDDSTPLTARVVSLAANPAGNLLVCISSHSQMASLNIEKTALQTASKLSPMRISYHIKAERTPCHILGMDICSRKPLVVTCGTDKTVRTWNFQTNKEEVYKAFAEDAYSVSLHPSGLLLIIGFTDKLRLMSILADDLRLVREFSIKGCKECKFSTGGHLFAAVSGNQIQVYGTDSGDQVATLRGHNGKVRSLFWTPDDSTLLSSGTDGAIYQWNMEQHVREAEWVRKGITYSAAICLQSSDKKGIITTTVYAVSSESKLMEIELPAGQVVREIESDVVLGQVVISRNKKMLFASVGGGSKAGRVRAYKFPPLGSEYNEYNCLTGPVSRLALSRDDQFLFVTGEDGSLYTFEVRDFEGRRVIDSVEEYSEEVLINRSDLEEKNQMMNELKGKVEELKVNNDYQMRLKDMAFSEKVKELTEKYSRELELEQAKYDTLRGSKTEMDQAFSLTYKKLEAKHLHDLHDLEVKYQQLLIKEVERHRQLGEKKMQKIKEHEEARKAITEAHKRNVEEVMNAHELKLRTDASIFQDLKQENEVLARQCTESKQQLEEDVDTEIYRIKARFQHILNAGRETSLQLKGENGIMKKKFNALQGEIEEQKEVTKIMAQQHKQLLHDIEGLEQEIATLKKEIRARDETIGDKEKRIYELKKKNQELEKFKFVLDHKIKELKTQIEPREQEIGRMKEKIKLMDAELEKYHTTNAHLDELIGELREKLNSLQQDLLRQRRAIRDGETAFKRCQSGLSDCLALLQEPARLKERVLQLAENHAADNGQAIDVDTDIEKEYTRQRNHLRKTIETLQALYSQEMKAHERDNQRVVSENLSLIKEINSLRTTVSQAKHKYQQLVSESVLSATIGKGKKKALGTSCPLASTGEGVRDVSAALSPGQGMEEDPRIVLESQRETLSSLRDMVKKYEEAIAKAQRPPTGPQKAGIEG